MSTATLPPPLPSSAPAVAPVVPIQPIWNTPQILWRALWVVWICDVLLLGALLVASRAHESALKTIGRDTAPSIIASQQIKTALADMDANAANELLGDAIAAKTAYLSFIKRRAEGAGALIAAAQSIAYGDAERVPIINIQLELGEYERYIQRARDLREAGKSSFVTSYNQAAAVLDNSILTAADALDEANLKELDAAYSRQRSRSFLARALLFAAATLLLLTLIVIQRFLFRRTNRVINVPLFAASLLTLIFAASSLRAVSSAQGDLKRAKEDAFTSIHALWRARAVGYAAKVDESRFLLDPSHSKEREEGFFAKRDLLAKLPTNISYASEAAAAEAGTRPGFTGYLADELNNITFPGEREAAADALRTFDRYMEIDSQMRKLESQRQHREAVALCLGTAQGQSSWAFDQFDAALGRTLKINQDAFDASIAAGFAALRNYEVKAAVFAVIVAMLCLLGLLQRIREYQ